MKRCLNTLRSPFIYHTNSDFEYELLVACSTTRLTHERLIISSIVVRAPFPFAAPSKTLTLWPCACISKTKPGSNWKSLILLENVHTQTFQYMFHGDANTDERSRPCIHRQQKLPDRWHSSTCSHLTSCRASVISLLRRGCNAAASTKC